MIALGDRSNPDDVAMLVATSAGPPPNPETFDVYRRLYRL
jgi:hypothetical protein